MVVDLLDDGDGAPEQRRSQHGGDGGHWATRVVPGRRGVEHVWVPACALSSQEEEGDGGSGNGDGGWCPVFSPPQDEHEAGGGLVVDTKRQQQQQQQQPIPLVLPPSRAAAEEAILGIRWPDDGRVVAGAAEVIEGRARAGNARGGRAMFVLADGGDGRVERMVLQEAEARRGWWGVHCEGSFLRALFALLLWDLLFDAGVPGACTSVVCMHACAGLFERHY